MARSPRVPKAAGVEAGPSEPDLLDNQRPPREADALFGHGIEMARLAHALRTAPPQGIIIEGPRGVGKATLAFRMAKALLSGGEIADDFAFDAEGRSAGQVRAGTHPNVLHLTRPYDEKAKRFKTELGVDTVRRILPFLGTTAAGTGWRVVIVDAVDDMNPNAANALLKNLEEPPQRTLFALVAHIAGRVLPTIRSRCRTVRLKPLGTDEVTAALSYLGADPSLADTADGSVRRALSLAASGADAVRTAERLLAKGLTDATSRFALADLAAQKRGEHFAVIADLTLDALARAARTAAASSNAAGEGYARAYLEALGERRRVEIFNLDRKEFMLALGNRLAAAASATRGA